MSQEFWLYIVACDRVFFAGLSEKLIIPGLDGEKGILAHHEDMVMAVTPGEARFYTKEEGWVPVVVGRGFTQVMNNRVTLLVETAEGPDEIDVRRAQEAKERAMEMLRQRKSIQEYYHSQASMSRAMSRLKATARHSTSGVRAGQRLKNH